MIKRKAKHRYVYVVEFFSAVRLGIGMHSFLSQTDAVEYANKRIVKYAIDHNNNRTATFQVHKLPLHSATK